ncbi:MAG TPA: hypothetical protein IGS52_05060 [Oscillatoriaceae cyanobacterium M33_DOE_052]|uniref:Uncharacterized protein n=1 Tax=Planktothricoides sp. SpSt-374 TaxID=2282167 RepID=A0A7C3ZYT8_9CYAN|nr:hypothetical protein [Oscillatoriaceae cyanobacterium M33_DOE_052]
MTNLAYIYGRTFSIIQIVCQVSFGVKGFWENLFGAKKPDFWNQGQETRFLKMGEFWGLGGTA